MARKKGDVTGGKGTGKTGGTAVTIKAPAIDTLVVKIVGTAPYVQNAFSRRQRDAIIKTHMAGSTSRSKKVREPKDFDALFNDAHHRSSEGWVGIPAPCFRAGMISACRLIGFKMTLAKLALFVKQDGFDADDGTPLVKLVSAKPPERHIATVRNANGQPDIRCRPMWREWSAVLNIRFDSDVFTKTDVVNLLSRVGEQVGIGEGRPDSKNSAGLGWGTFRIATEGAK